MASSCVPDVSSCVPSGEAPENGENFPNAITLVLRTPPRPKPPRQYWRGDACDDDQDQVSSSGRQRRFFVPLSQRGRVKSLEVLAPEANSPLREAPLWACVVSMLSTIIGGGALSLPYAFKLTGAGPGLCLLLFSALSSDFSLYALCSASRRTGTSTLAELARAAQGPHLETAVVVALFILCGFVAVAYTRLLRDLLSIFLQPFAATQEMHVAITDRALILAAAAVIFPLSLYRELHRLRYAGFLSFGGSIALAALFASRAAPEIDDLQGALSRLARDPSTSTWAVAVEALPIMAMSYICQFNILSVHARLRDPTRARLKGLLHLCCGIAFFFYVVFGLAGQIVCADVPNDVAQDALSCLARNDVGAATDPYLACAGGAFALSILLNTPALIIPLRDALEHIANKFVVCGKTVSALSAASSSRRRLSSSSHRRRQQQRLSRTQPVEKVGAQNERTPLCVPDDVEKKQDHFDDDALEKGKGGPSLAVPKGQRDDDLDSASPPPTQRDASGDATPQTQQRETRTPGASCLHTCLHAVLTAGIVFAVVVSAQKVPGVASVWAVAGSSVGLFVAYLLPCYLYLKVRGHKEGGPAFLRNALCVFLFVFSLLLAIVCTYTNTKKIIFGPS